MLIIAILAGTLVGGFLGHRAVRIGVDGDHQGLPGQCPVPASACGAAQSVVAFITLICTATGGLIAGIFFHAFTR